MLNQYEPEHYIHEQVPMEVYVHHLARETIYTVQHWHNSVELNLVTNGRMMYIINGRQFPRQKGDLILINSGDLHSGTWIEKNDIFEGVTVLISKPFLDSWLGEHTWLRLPEDPSVCGRIAETMEKISQIDRSADPYNQLLAMEQLFRLMVILGKSCICEAGDRGSSEQAMDRIKGVVRYLNIHYKENLSLSEVAEVFGCTPVSIPDLQRAHRHPILQVPPAYPPYEHN